MRSVVTVLLLALSYVVVTAQSTLQPAGNTLNYGTGNDYVVIDNLKSYDFANNDWTIGFWVKPEAGAAATVQGLITKRNNGTNIMIPTPQYNDWSLLYETTTGFLKFSYNNTASFSSSYAVLTNDVWTHVALRKSNDTIYFLYDGIAKDTLALSPLMSHRATIPVYIGSAPVGGTNYSSGSFCGSIDEVVFWDKAVSDASINQMMNRTLTSTWVNANLLDATWSDILAYYRFDDGTPSGANAAVDTLASELDIIAGTNTYNGVLNGFTLSGDNANWINSSAPLGVITNTGLSFPSYNSVIISGTQTGDWLGSDPVIERGVVYSTLDHFDPYFTSGSEMTYVASTDLLSQNSFSTQINDLVQGRVYTYKAYILTNSGHYAYGQERILAMGEEPSGNAINLDGTDDYLDIFLESAQNTSEWSIDFWVKPDLSISGTDNVILYRSLEAYGYNTLRLNYDATNDEFDLRIREGSSASDATVTANLTVDQWNHVAIIFDGSDIKYYLNGTNQGNIFTGVTPAIYNLEKLIIGADAGPANYFKGEIDELHFWNADISTDINSLRFVEPDKETLDAAGYGVGYSDLYLYYNFNQGEAYGNNSGSGSDPQISQLIDQSQNGFNATIHNMALGNSAYGDYQNDTISNFTVSGLYNLQTLETVLDLSLTSATLTGYIEGPWFDNGLTTRGVVISELDNFDPRNSAAADTIMFYSTDPLSKDTFTIQVDGLEVNTRYFYRVFALSNEGVLTYANQEELITSIDPPGYALDFDGNDDRVQTPVTKSDLGNDYTITLWMKYEGDPTGNYYSPIIGAYEAAGNSDFSIAKDYGNAQFYVRDGYARDNWGAGTTAFDGKWHHLAFRMVDGIGYLYIDGELLSFDDFNGAAAAEQINIGWDQRYNRAFDGKIDEVRIWNVALDMDDIRNMMDRTIDNDYITNNLSGVSTASLLAYYRFDTGLPEGDNSTISVVQDFSSSGNTATMSNFALTGGNSNFVYSEAALGLQTMNQNMPVSGTSATLKGAVTGIWTVNAPTSGGFCYSTTKSFNYHSQSKVAVTFSNDTLTATINSLTRGETYYYRAFGVNGTDTVWGNENSFVVEDDVPGNAIWLDGTNDLIISSDNIDISSQSFTLETWARKSDVNARGYFFGQGIAGTNEALYVGYRDANTLTISFYGNDVNIDVNPDDLWHHYAFVYDAATKTRRIYMDGNLLTTYANTTREHFLGTGDFYVGGGFMYAGGYNADEFNGEMDEVRVWKAVLDRSDIRSLMTRTIDQTWTDANLSTATWSNLQLYYRLDQGIPSGDNNQERRVFDYSGKGNDGYAVNMNYAGSSSNYVASGANIGVEITDLTVGETTASFDAETTGIWVSGATPDEVGFYYSTHYAFQAASGTLVSSTLSGSTFFGSISGLDSAETYYVKAFIKFGTDTTWSPMKPFVTASNPPGNNLLFDGANDYVSVPFDNTLDVTSNFTVEAWVKGTSENWTGWDGIVYKPNSYWLRTQGGQKNMYFYVYADGGWRNVQYVAPTGFDIRVWHHYAGVLENDTLRIFVDGVMYNEVAMNNTIDATDENSLYIGYTGYFDGNIDEVRIWDTDLSTDDIKEIKNRTLTESWVNSNMTSANWTNLKAYYRFDQGIPGGDNTDETFFYDFSSYGNHGSLMNFDLTGSTSNWVASSAFLGVETHEVVAIGFDNATIRGSLTGTWYDNVDAVGLVYSATQGFDPSLANGVDIFEEVAQPEEINGDEFTIDIAGLVSGKKYFFRAFARINGVTTYGEEKFFATAINPPGNALAFAGDNDYVRVYNTETISPTDEITIELWTKNIGATWSDYYCLVTKRDAYWLLPVRGSKRLYFRVYNQDLSYRQINFYIPQGIDLEDWHHYAFTYDGSTMKMYIDGKLMQSGNFGTTLPINQSDYNLRIGRSTGNNYYEGRIDEVRIWHKALTASQIDYIKNRTIDKELVNDMIGLNWTDLGVNFRFDQGIADAENPGEHYLYDFSGNGNRGILFNFDLVGSASNWVGSDAALGVTTLTDFDFVTGTGTFNAVTTDLWHGNFTDRGIAYSDILNFAPSEGDAFSTRSSSTPLAQDTFNAVVNGLTSREMIFYRGYATTDNVHYAYGESQAFVPGINPPGNALDFDGSDDYIQVGHSGSVSPEEELTVELWAKSDNALWSSYGMVYKPNEYRLLPYPNSDRINFLVYTSDNSYRQVTYDPPESFDLTQYHHYAGTYDGYEVRIYVDGFLKASEDYGTFMPIRDDQQNDLLIGRYNGTNHFQGQMDELRIWKKALTAEELQEVMSRTIDRSYVDSLGLTTLTYDDLGMYMRFDQGEAGGNNTKIPIVYDYTGNKNFGGFNNFTLLTTNSNFVQSTAGIGVATQIATGVSFDQATLNGELTGIFYEDVTEKGFVYSDVSFDPYAPGGASLTKLSVPGIEPGDYNADLTNLGFLTDYYYRAYYKTGSSDYIYGNERRFSTTLNPPGYALHFDRSDDRVNIYDLEINDKDTVTADFWMNWEGNYNMMPVGFNNYGLRFIGGFFGFFTNSNDLYGMANADELANKWVHVAAVFVRNDVEASKLYINGVEQKLERRYTPPTERELSVDFRIGTMNNSNGDDFQGTIDEFRFWNKELTSVQVNEVMDRTLDKPDVDSIAGLSWDNNLLVYYRFDQGNANGDNTGMTEIRDLSNYGHNGEVLNFTLTGDRGNIIVSNAHIGVKTVPDVTDQVNDEVKLYGEITGIWNTTFTDSGFVYSTTKYFVPETEGTYVGADLAESGNQYAKVVTGLPNSTKYYFRSYVVSEWDTPGGTVSDTVYGIQKEFLTAGVYTTKKYYNLQDDQIELYYQLVGTPLSGSLTSGIKYSTTEGFDPVSTGTSVVGSAYASDTLSSLLTGLTEGTTYFYRPYVTNGSSTLYGDEAFFVAGWNPPGNALVFAGSDDHIVVGPANEVITSQNFTLTTWIKYSYTGLGTIFKAPRFGSTAYTIALYINRNSLNQTVPGKLSVQFLNESYDSEEVASVSSDFNDDKWHFVAVTMGEEGLKLYVDGVLEGESTYRLYTAGFGSSPAYIGMYDPNYNEYRGEMDEFRIWKRELNVFQLDQMMYRTIDEDYVNDSISGISWDDLLLYYRFDQGVAGGTNTTEDQVFDYSKYAWHGTLNYFDLTGTNANWIESTAPLGVETMDASAVYTLGEATMQGNLTDLWYTAPVDTGFVYSNTQGFDPPTGTAIDANVHVNDSLFTRTLTGLDPVLKYYYRAYATAANGRTTYGIERTFIPGGVNTLDTLGFIDGDNAEVFGMVTGDFTGIAGDTGVWYAPVPDFNPASYPSNYAVYSGGSTDTFMVDLTNLDAGRTYYYRAFVDVTSGSFTGSRVFGEERSFRTLSNPPGNAIDLDGANDFINMFSVGEAIGETAASGYTWEAWVNSGIETGDRTLWSMTDTLGDYERVWLQSVNHNSERHLRLRLDNTYYYSTTTIEDSLWHHIALTVDPVTPKTRLYVDGEMVLDLDVAHTIELYDIAAVGARLYDLRNVDRFFDGSFDEIRVWDHALTQSQLQQMMYRTIDQSYVDTDVSALNWSDLIAYYRMDLGLPGANNDEYYELHDLSGNNVNAYLTDLALSGATSNWIFSGAPLGVTTESATSYTDDGGNFYGAITGVWYSAPMDSGIVYSVVSGFDPDTATKVSSGLYTATDTFKVEMRDIFTPGQYYYYRAYVQVSDSIWTYGNENAFYAGGVITLDSVANLTSVEATCFGEVVSAFPTAVDTGIVYYLVEGSDPDTVNSSQYVSTVQQNVSMYQSVLTGLIPATRYYYRAYVDLGSGNYVFGDEYSFITVSTPPGRALDLDLTNDYVEISHSTDLNPTTQMSYSLWAKSNYDLWTTASGYGVMLSKGEAYLFRGSRNSKQIQAYFYFEGSGWRSLTYNPEEYFQIDEWHQYAVTFDGNTFALYVDGDLKSSTTNYSGYTIRANNTSVQIGHDSRYTNQNDQNFRGQIDELRIWNIGLTQSQIVAMMDRSISEDYLAADVAGVDWTNLELYYTMDDGTPGGDNTGLLSINDDSGNGQIGAYINMNLTGNTSNYVASGAHFGIVTDTLIYNPDLTTHILTGHITGIWYTLPDQVGFQYSTARDFSVAPVKVYGTIQSDSSFTATVTGLTLGETYYYRAITEVSAVTSYGFTRVLQTMEGNPNGFVSNGNALALDGNDDYVFVENPSLRLDSRSFTVEMWSRKRYNDSWGYLFSQGSGTTNYGLHVGYADYNTLRFNFWGNDVGVDVIPDTLWHHVAFVYDATTKTRDIYFDGRLMRSYTNVSREHYLGTGDAYVGARLNGAYEFEGDMDEVRVWTAALDQNQINTLKSRTVDSLYISNSGLGLSWDDLKLYYRFDQGTPDQNNFGEYYVYDYSNPRNEGALVNFSLGGGESNFIRRSAPIGVETTEISNIGTTFAHVEGRATDAWNNNIIMRGVVYSPLNDFDPENVADPADTTQIWSTTDLVINTFEVDLSGLNVGGQYSYATMVVADNGDTAYSTLNSFNTVMDPPGHALSLDGGNDYVSITDTLDLASRSFSFEIWARKRTENEAGYFLSQGQTTTNYGLHIGYRDWNTVTMAFYGNDVNVDVVPDTLWHQYAFVYDADTKTRTIYMDGDSIYEYTNAAREHYLGTGETFIGRYLTGNYFNGDIDEIRIWHTALTDEQVSDLAFRTIDSTYVNNEVPGLHWDSLYVNYRFDQGEPSLNNSGVTTVTDLSGNLHTGLLTDMALSGEPSNWIKSKAGIGVKTVRNASPILASFATLHSQVTGKWYSAIVDSGIVYNTVPNFIPRDTAIAFISANQPSVVDTFVTLLSGLEHSTDYYYRPFVVSALGDTVYGLQQMFTTSGIETLDSAENVSGTSLTLFGRLNNPVASPLDTGIVISETRDFVPNSGTFVPGSLLPASTNTFGSDIIGLKPSTVYFFRAYIYNATDTLYGEQRMVRTLSNPAGNAVNFDGVDDWIELPSNLMSASGLSGSDELTIEFYYKGTDLQSAIRIQEGTDNYIIIGFNNPPMAVMSNNSGVSGALSISNVQDVEDNEWHHIAMTWKRNIASGFRVYVDGEMVDDNSSTNIPIPSFTSNATVSIGSYNGNGAYPFLSGTMDEIRIWNKSLTQNQLQQVFERTLDADFVNSKVAGLAWSDLVAYYRSDLGEAGLDNTSIYQFMDFTSNDFDGTPTNLALNGSTSNFIESDAFSGVITTPDYYTIPSASEADVYAHLTGIWYDAVIDSGAVYSAVQGFDPDTVPSGRFITAFTTQTDTFVTRLPGLNSGQEYYYRAFLITETGDTAYGNESVLIAGGIETLEQADRLGASILTYGRMTGEFATASDTGMVYSTVNGFDPADYPSNFVSTLDGGQDTFSVQINNLQVNTDYYYRAYVINGTDSIYGSQRMYHTADNPAGNALQYDGTGDYVQVLTPIANELNAAGEMTLEAWVKPDDVGTLRTILGFTSSNGSVNRIILSVDVNNHITAIINSTNYPLIGGGVDLADGEWHHVAVVSTQSPAATEVYIDGLLVGTANEWAGFNPTDILGVGVEYNYVSGRLPVSHYQGGLDEIRIWNRALTDDQRYKFLYRTVSEEYLDTIPGISGANLIAYYRFDQGIAGGNNAGETRLFDFSGNENHGDLMNFALNGTTSNWVQSGALTGVVTLDEYEPQLTTALTKGLKTGIWFNGHDSTGVVYSAVDGFDPATGISFRDDDHLLNNDTIEATITGLSEGGIYYYRSYVAKDGVVKYGQQKLLQTGGVYTLNQYDSISGDSITLYGSIVGNVSPVNYGFVYSVNSDLSGATTVTTTTITNDTFNITVTGLTPGQTYYFAAIVNTTAPATIYGDTLKFATLSNPAGNALDFDATDSYISFDNKSIPQALSAVTNGLTVETWFNTTQIVDQQALFGFHNTTGSVNRFIIDITNDDRLAMYVNDVQYIIGNDVTDDAWHHIAVVSEKSPAETRVYLDGNLVYTLGEWVGILSADQMVIGGELDNSAIDEVLYGRLDEFRIWDMPLTTAQLDEVSIASLDQTYVDGISGLNWNDLVAYYNFDFSDEAGDNSTWLPYLLDNSGNGNNGTFNNFVLTGTDGNFILSDLNIGVKPLGVTSVGSNDADVQGEVIGAWYDKSNISRGVAYSQVSNFDPNEPTDVEGTQAALTDGYGLFTVTLSGLMDGTKYYFRPYAEYNGQRVYGAIDSLNTNNTSLYYVDIDAAGANNGSSWANAYNSLSDALAVAGASDTVFVAEGTYYPETDVSGNATPADNRTKTFTIRPGVYLVGGFNGTESDIASRAATGLTVISGDLGTLSDNSDNSYHVMTVNGFSLDTLKLEGVTIEDGNADGTLLNSYGGGIYAPGFHIDIHSSTIHSNTAVNGGAIYFDASNRGWLNIVNTTIYNNAATTDGGALYLYGLPEQMEFDGINDHVQAPNSVDGRRYYTWYARIRTTDTQTFVDKTQSPAIISAESGDVSFFVDNGYLGYYDTFGSVTSVVTSAYVADGLDHEIVMVRENGVVRLYVDGAQVDGDITTGTTVFNSANLLFGTLNTHYAGNIFEIKIFSRNLSAAEVASIGTVTTNVEAYYINTGNTGGAGGTWADQTGNANHGIVFGTPDIIGSVDTTVYIVNTTIAANTYGDESAIYVDGSKVSVSNTILWNQGSEITGTDVEIRNSIVRGGTGDNTYDLNNNIWPYDPFLDPAGLTDNGGYVNTVNLFYGPAVDGGITLNAPIVDATGAVRTAVPDIGAVEFGVKTTGQSFDMTPANVNVTSSGFTAYNARTVEFWFKPETTMQGDYIKLSGSVVISVNATEQVTVTGMTSPTIYIDGVAGNVLTAGVWQHVAVVSAADFTVDDIQIANVSGEVSGLVDEIRIWNLALSTTQMNAVRFVELTNDGINLVDPVNRTAVLTGTVSWSNLKTYYRFYNSQFNDVAGGINGTPHSGADVTAVVPYTHWLPLADMANWDVPENWYFNLIPDSANTGYVVLNQATNIPHVNVTGNASSETLIYGLLLNQNATFVVDNGALVITGKVLKTPSDIRVKLPKGKVMRIFNTLNVWE
ncbi:LamG-like jellyroll fold domain-containing protein [Saccharicrinis sp. FJH62]|uniref:LamG-like jellyroll fold domain-containing protein n=1 Tax=Saccharicrinis sp. FJH62 TaxID=3344657 RepID=UPI0035D48278